MIYLKVDYNFDFKNRTFTMKNLVGDEPDFQKRTVKFNTFYTYGYSDPLGFHFIVKNPNGVCIGKILRALSSYAPEWIDDDFT